jgi:hypothetical protein
MHHKMGAKVTHTALCMSTLVRSQVLLQMQLKLYQTIENKLVFISYTQ